MPDPTLQELQAKLLTAKADLAAIKAEEARLNALDTESQLLASILFYKAKIAALDACNATTPFFRRRRFKSITQVQLPSKNGDAFLVFAAICEEDRAWYKDPDTELWIEIQPLPAI